MRDFSFSAPIPFMDEADCLSVEKGSLKETAQHVENVADELARNKKAFFRAYSANSRKYEGDSFDSMNIASLTLCHRIDKMNQQLKDFAGVLDSFESQLKKSDNLQKRNMRGSTHN